MIFSKSHQLLNAHKNKCSLINCLRTDAHSNTLTGDTNIRIDYQRQRAKELVNFFNDSKRGKDTQDAKPIGWTLKNEITNGRWVMMGLAIGMLTEYATGVDFIDQIKLTISYLGIADIA